MSRFLQTRSDVVYTGVDIVSNVIEHHRKTFIHRDWMFLNLDIVSEPINVADYDLIMNLDVVSEPINVADYDLIMTRMMMQHLTHGDVIRIMHKFSNITTTYRRPTFLLATTFSNTVVNKKLDISNSARFELLNLEIEPFRLEAPLCLFRDGPPKSVHFMGLWQLPLKVVAESSCGRPVAVSSPLSKHPMYSCTDWTLLASKHIH